MNTHVYAWRYMNVFIPADLNKYTYMCTATYLYTSCLAI